MPLKKILPAKNYTLVTKLAAEEVCRRIAENTGPQKISIFLGKSHTTSKPYEGVVSKNSFEIKRVITYRNSFLPVIKGNVYEVDGKTNVKIEMSVYKWVSIFVLIVAGLSFIAGFFFNKSLSNPATPAPFNNFIFKSLNSVLPIVIIGVMYISFFKESNISKIFLSKLLEEENS